VLEPYGYRLGMPQFVAADFAISANTDVCFGPKADMNLSRTELLQRWNYRFCITNLALKVQELLDRISVEVFDLDQPHWNVALRASRMPNLFSRNMFQMTV
jgi:hypothetical protein